MGVAALACLAAFGYYSTLDPRNKPFEFSLLVSDAVGLEIGDPVMVRGLKIGMVNETVLHADGVLITLRIETKNRPFIDTRLSAWVVVSTETSGKRQLRLAAGRPPGQLIQWDAVLKLSWAPPKDVDDAIDTVPAAPAVIGRPPMAQSSKLQGQKKAPDNGKPSASLSPHPSLPEPEVIAAIEAVAKTPRVRLVIHKIDVADSKLNGKPWDFLGGPPDLQLSAWCGDQMLLISPKYEDVYTMEFGGEALATGLFEWPAGQSVGLKIVDRDVRHDDKIGAVNLPYQARALKGSKRFQLKGSSLMTIDVSVHHGAE